MGEWCFFYYKKCRLIQKSYYFFSLISLYCGVVGHFYLIYNNASRKVNDIYSHMSNNDFMTSICFIVPKLKTKDCLKGFIS